MTKIASVDKANNILGLSLLCAAWCSSVTKLFYKDWTFL